MGNKISNGVEQTNVLPETAPAKLSAFNDLFKQALKIYEALFKKAVTLALISIVGIVPLMIVIFILGFTGGQSPAIKGLLGLLFLAALALLFYISSAAQAATLLLLEDSSRSVGELFKKGIGLVWPVVVVTFLSGLLILLWTLLLIVPGIIFSVYYSFSIYALIYEKQTGMAALKRSQALVKNYWWAIVGRSLLMILAYAAVFLVLSLPIFFLPEDSALAIFWNMVLSAVRFITGPIFVIFAYLIFKELVNIKGSILTNAAQKTI